MKRVLTVLLALVATAACGGSSNSTTSPSQVYTTDTLTGTVPVPVNGVLQSSFGTFAVGQGGGTIYFALTSAIETLPDGTFLPTVVMGLGIGTFNGSTCTLLPNATAQIAASANQYQYTVAAGNYCIQMSDVTNQLGPVSYAIAIAHP